MSQCQQSQRGSKTTTATTRNAYLAVAGVEPLGGKPICLISEISPSEGNWHLFSDKTLMETVAGVSVNRSDLC